MLIGSECQRSLSALQISQKFDHHAILSTLEGYRPYLILGLNRLNQNLVFCHFVLYAPCLLIRKAWQPSRYQQWFSIQALPGLATPGFDSNPPYHQSMQPLR